MYSLLGIIFFIGALLSHGELVGLMIVSALFFIAAGISALVSTIREILMGEDENDDD